MTDDKPTLPSTPTVKSWHGPVAEIRDELDRLQDSHRQLRNMSREHREEEVLAREAAQKRLGSVEYDVGELKANVTAIKAEVSEVKTEMGSQTTTLAGHTVALADLKKESGERTEILKEIQSVLQPFKSVFSHPKVQTALVGLVLAAILALTAILTKGHP